MIVVLFGAPGSGKGTQARFISKSRGIPAISTGDMLRAECRAGTTLGQAACAVLTNGKLLDDATMNTIVAKRIEQADCSGGFILDGYPRTIPQAIALSELLKRSGLPEPAIVHLDVPDATLVTRLSSRRYCPSCGRTYHLVEQPPIEAGQCDGDGEALVQRNDDEATVVLERLHAYYELTQPLIQHYQGPHYHRVDGDCAPQEVLQRIEAAIRTDQRVEECRTKVFSRRSPRFCTPANGHEVPTKPIMCE